VLLLLVWLVLLLVRLVRVDIFFILFRLGLELLYFEKVFQFFAKKKGKKLKAAMVIVQVHFYIIDYRICIIKCVFIIDFI